MPPTVFTSNDSRSYFAVGSQTAAGTPATTYQFSKWLEGGFEHDRAVTVEREGGDGQDNNLSYVEHHFAGAPLTEYARPDNLLRKLAYALGQSSVVATSPVFQHEIIPQPDPRLVTLEQYAPGQSIGEVLQDSVIDELTVEHELGKPMKLSMHFTGGGTPLARAVGSARTVTQDVEAPFLFHQASIQTTIAGVAIADDTITGWKLTFKRNVDDAVQGVGLGRQAIPALSRDVTLEVRRRYVSAVDHNAVNYAGGSVGVPSVATGAFKANYAYNMQAANASNRTAEIEIPLGVITEIGRNVFEPDGQTVYETWKMTALKGATHIMRAQVKNAVATHIASGAL